ncbi:MAG: hypothetical protein IV100_31590, partial [Myxococcales bacterium]|nr:hypothetical protein [Myxococcales bacterium]
MTSSFRFAAFVFLVGCTKTETITTVVPSTTGADVTDASDATDGAGATDGADGTDATDGTDDATDATDGTDTPTFAVACPSDLPPFGETEPNDHWSSSNDAGAGASPGFCIQGSVLCGNDGKDGYGNPGDHVVFTLPAPASVTFALDWDVTADFDLLIAPDFESGPLTVT